MLRRTLLISVVLSTSLAFAQLDSNSVTVTASRSTNLQLDQAIYSVRVDSVLDTRPSRRRSRTGPETRERQRSRCRQHSGHVEFHLDLAGLFDHSQIRNGAFLAVCEGIG